MEEKKEKCLKENYKRPNTHLIVRFLKGGLNSFTLTKIQNVLKNTQYNKEPFILKVT